MLLSASKKFKHERLKSLGQRPRHIFATPAAPTITLDTTARSGGRNEYAWLNSAGTRNPNITFVGVQPQTIRQRSSAVTQQDCAWTDYAMGYGGANGPLNNQWAVEYTGKGLDIIVYTGDILSVWQGDELLVSISNAAQLQQTAQAGASSSITLSSGASGTTGNYVDYYVTITSGTGSGQTRRISAYNGSTKVATVDTAWTTTPDATSVYDVTNSPSGFHSQKATLSYLHLDWPTESTYELTVIGGQRGFIVEQYGILAPAAPRGWLPVLVVGDSFWEGSASPRYTPKLIECFGRALGDAQISNLSGGGTGFIARYDANQRLNFQDRIAPPDEAIFANFAMSAGTYTISLTYNGVTSTTPALAYNASTTTIMSALNGLSNVVAAGGDVAVGGYPLIFCPHNMPGCTISFDTSGATGTITHLGQWTGDVDRTLPRDGNGDPLPFILFVPGSGNDSSYTDAQVQAAAVYVATEINARFPTAIPIFTGIVGDAQTGSAGTIGATDLSRNAAIATGAAILPKINGQVPFIDTYANGLNGNKLLYGAGSNASPVAGTTAKFKAISNAGHPTGLGARYLGTWCAKQLLDLVQP